MRPGTAMTGLCKSMLYCAVIIVPLACDASGMSVAILSALISRFLGKHCFWYPVLGAFR